MKHMSLVSPLASVMSGSRSNIVTRQRVKAISRVVHVKMIRDVDGAMMGLDGARVNVWRVNWKMQRVQRVKRRTGSGLIVPNAIVAVTHSVMMRATVSNATISPVAQIASVAWTIIMVLH